MISSITSSSCSHGWSCGHAVSSAAKIFGTWADHPDLPCLLHLHFQLHLLDVSSLHSHPFFQGFYLIPQINKENVACFFFLCFCNLLCCILFSFITECVEPFLGMLTLFFCCQLQCYSSFSSLAEIIESFLRMLILPFIRLGSLKCLLQFPFDSHC
jgi:hypothetical protein